MIKEIQSQLGFGPMSPEIIEAIIKASKILGKAFMLINTQNQIDWNGGYVNKWNTKQYVEYVNKIRKKYPGNTVYLCRDHCGPGFKENSNISDIYKTVSDDIDNGFDLIHVDFSKISPDKDLVLEESIKVIKYMFKKKSDMMIEIGTEENVGEIKDNIREILKELNYIQEFVRPQFFVVQTGSLVKEMFQVGKFNKSFVLKVHELLLKNNVKLKEHNCDYLNFNQIKQRQGIVDAMNIAPQLGVIQTLTVINEALVYGIDINLFLECSFKSGKWNKWLYFNNKENKMLCSILAGHYNYISDEYKQLISNLEKYTDIKKIIINRIIDLITYYSNAFN